ncbi:MAG: CvpA family protein [Mangrovicoccus sp.]
MSGFTWVDGAVAGVILFSAILAYARGLTREILAILGWIAAAIAAFIFAPLVEPLVKEIPVVGDLLRDSCELSILAASIVVFAIGLLVMSIISPVFAGIVKSSEVVGPVDQILGFIYGTLRGLVLVAALLLVYDQVVVSFTYEPLDTSRSAAIFANIEDQLAAQIPTNAPGWILERYEELVGSCVSVL